MNDLRSVIKAGAVFTGDEEINEPCYILVEQGLIKDIILVRNSALPEGRLIDLSDLYVLPGLIDCHVHLFMEGIFDMPERGRRWKETREITLLRAAENLERTIKSGVTTVRDLGCPPQMTAVLAEAIKKKIVLAPDLLRAGQAISITGGHFYYSGNYQADGAEEVRKAVRVLCREKVQVIKLMLTGCVNFVLQNAGAVEFTQEEIVTAVEEAHRLGRKAAVHVNGKEGVKLALDSGADTIEHGALLDDDIIDYLTEKDFYWIPTLIPFQRMYDYGVEYDYAAFPPEKVAAVYEKHYSTVRKAFAAGVKIAVGTDAGSLGVLHGDVLSEIKLLKQYGGLKPKEALQAATKWAAEALGVEESRGTLAIGKKADIIGVKKNPLADLDSLREIAFVCHSGEIVYSRD